MKFLVLFRYSVGLIVCCSVYAVYSSFVEDEDNYSNSTTVCKCTQQTVNQTKKYFVYNNKPVTFMEAWRQCQNFGQQLATVTSKEESLVLEQAIAKSSKKSGRWYIAGTDMGNEGNFVWITTNRPVGYGSGYLNYHPGQPDNFGGKEHCLLVGYWGGVTWNDVPCDSKNLFICESIG